jgi:hypothetical protein
LGRQFGPVLDLSFLDVMQTKDPTFSVLVCPRVKVL